MSERDSLQHGDLTITTHRRPDGVLVVRINPGREDVEVHQYPLASPVAPPTGE